MLLVSTENIVEAEGKFSAQVDEGLIKAIRQGDPKAYRQLYDRHLGRVYALCYRLTADKGLAEDATQEVFVQLWQKLENYRGDSKFTTWLHSVASNITISYIRKQKGWWKKMFSIDDSEVMQYSAEESAGDVSLDDYIVRLPERARLVFVLHAIEGYRHEEIATMLKMAVGSSKAQFHRSKQLLKEWMGYE
jgi:RNA polymerase sigma-70 factor (ECF subfamily)